MEERQLKFILVGDARVGKTEILENFTNSHHTFSRHYAPTVGADFASNTIEMNGIPYNIECLEIGSKLFPPPTNFLKDSNAIAVILDGTQSPEDLQKAMTKWVDSVKAFPGTAIYFIVNKTDLKPLPLSTDKSFIGEAECQAAAATWNEARKTKNPNHRDIPVLFCSAKDNIGINAAFNKMTEDCVQKIHLQEKNKQKAPEVSENTALWENFKNFLSKHKIWAGVNLLLLFLSAPLLILFIMPTLDILKTLPLLTSAVATNISAAALVVWNVGCAIVNGLRSTGESPSTIVDSPPISEDSQVSGASLSKEPNPYQPLYQQAVSQKDMPSQTPEEPNQPSPTKHT